MSERLENVMAGIDGVPDMALMSLPAVIIREFKDELAALRKERDELREYKLNVGLELANRMAHIEQLKKELAAALSEEGENMP